MQVFDETCTFFCICRKFVVTLQRKQNGITTIINWKYSILVLTLAALLLSGCKSRAVEEAREVITVADSLRAKGQGYTDSVAIAEAYNTLEKWQYLYPTDYVHACYHYGRLLRNSDNPVAAMQVFINGTHSRTKDYHILGRIYSNMGSISHLAGEYQLAYDMYSRSADLFLQNGDTLLYYYGLNNLAVELAEQREETATEYILSLIRLYEDHDLYVKSMETEAILMQNIDKYSSAINIIDSAQVLGYSEILGYMIKARSYSYLNQPDSALYYVNRVVPQTQNPAYLVDAYYILSNDDKTLSSDSILTITSIRADIQKEWGLHQGVYSQSVQLLEQDINRTPDIKWLLAMLVTILLFGGLTYIYVANKRKQRKLLSQQVIELERKSQTEKQRHEQMLQEHAEYKDSVVSQIEQTCAVLYKSSHLKDDLRWSNFDKMCDVVNQQLCFIANKLQTTYLLNDKEIRLCILILIGISNSKQLADMICYGESGIRNLKNRTAKKLSTNSIELRNKLLKIAVGEYFPPMNN